MAMMHMTTAVRSTQRCLVFAMTILASACATRERTPAAVPSNPSTVAVGASADKGTAAVQLSVWSRRNDPVVNVAARLRNVTTGRIHAVTMTSVQGRASFMGIPAGTYTIEVVDNKDKLRGVSTLFTLGDGEVVASIVRLR